MVNPTLTFFYALYWTLFELMYISEVEHSTLTKVYVTYYICCPDIIRQECQDKCGFKQLLSELTSFREVWEEMINLSYKMLLENGQNTTFFVFFPSSIIWSVINFKKSRVTCSYNSYF